jgi:hypothetical protein
MLLFQCNECEQRIPAVADRTPDQVFERLEEHIFMCPAATFRIEWTSEAARQRADYLRAALKKHRLAEKIRLK